MIKIDPLGPSELQLLFKPSQNPPKADVWLPQSKVLETERVSEPNLKWLLDFPFLMQGELALLFSVP